MPDRLKLNVVLCWHMHQPHYWDFERNEYRLPWTYLHAIKDYVDMAAHLEAVPKAKAVINFTPTLLEQIEDYRIQLQAHLNEDVPLQDPLLSALSAPVLSDDPCNKAKLIQACLKVNENRLINRFPVYRRLADVVDYFSDSEEGFGYLDSQFVIDLLVWYHITWMGETVRREDKRIQGLIEKGMLYTWQDRMLLITIIAELLNNIIPRYKRLYEMGQVELSVTPYGHPIMPLMLDMASAKEAMPDVSMPEKMHYPDGRQRVDWHIEKGIEVFQQFFGFSPKGCWPSEGAVCTDTLQMLDRHGFTWAATGQSVLYNSLNASGMADNLDHHWLLKPYILEGGDLHCFFRDDGLSDLIGFQYADWHADDAVKNFVNHLEAIQSQSSQPENVLVPIILDGENAWEYYPDNAYHFLSALYEKLASHPKLMLTTFEQFIQKKSQSAISLPRVVAGSWVYGTLSTWIGGEDKNRGWEMLIEAKQCFDRVIAEAKLSIEQIARVECQLAICEGSDWFWWFGDYNSAQSVSDFECLYRIHLSHLYALMKCNPPQYLSHAFTFGGGRQENDGVMIRNV
jgi:alpha-amylase/alpha-mannosidase (GH57 family)